MEKKESMQDYSSLSSNSLMDRMKEAVDKIIVSEKETIQFKLPPLLTKDEGQSITESCSSEKVHSLLICK
jgi:hypothetical protein